MANQNLSDENITYKVFTGTNKVMAGETEQFLPSKVHLINNTTYYIMTGESVKLSWQVLSL